MIKIILASKSEVRKKILLENGISCNVEPSKVDEDVIKNALLKEGATPEIISKNLAELKANKISSKNPDVLVLGADSVIDLDGEIISKPKSREEAFNILKKMSGKSHFLISSVCISKMGNMIWNYTDKAELVMKDFNDSDLKNYLSKISDKILYAYNVYQIEGEGKKLFSKIKGDKNTIMGLPIAKIKSYLQEHK
ncbi:Maf family protein [Candidatus Pelagibacter communis]|uniref:Maf family protein n=1 Tax=Pelagibacter ubique TaxID=198252 RepID=UPI00094BECE2|nr:nucleoside triphosphate pyrophosphatase [Candidatus Pelagibacter ubique]